MSHWLDDDQSDLSFTNQTSTTGKLSRYLDQLILVATKTGNPMIRVRVDNLVARHSAWYNLEPRIVPMRLNDLYKEIQVDMGTMTLEETAAKHQVPVSVLRKYLIGSKLWDDVSDLMRSIAEGTAVSDPMDTIINQVVDEVVNGKPVMVGGISDLAAKGISRILGGIDNFVRRSTEYTAQAIERNKRGQ
jgi:hypothetical protein